MIQTERLRRLLVQAGAAVTLHWEAGAGHALTPSDIAVARAWLQEGKIARGERAPAKGTPRGESIA